MTNQRLRTYIESLFAEAPKTRKTIELKEEILQNLSDKFNDLIAEGKDEDAAFNLAVAGIGDIDLLLDEMNKTTSVYSKDENEKDRRRSALFISSAVMLYILCPIPCLFLDNKIGPLMLFIMVAAATGLIIYNSMTRLRYEKIDDTMLEEFKQWKYSKNNQRLLIGPYSTVLWALTVTVYIIVSFTTMAWHITWVIFLIGVALNAILKILIDMKLDKNKQI
ncbi:MAG: permease prefix domain 1-containing protein [Eubacteriales bacterium]